MFSICLLDQSSSAMLLPFLEAAQNQILPPPPSPREPFPGLGLGPLANSTYTYDAPNTD